MRKKLCGFSICLLLFITGCGSKQQEIQKRDGTVAETFVNTVISALRLMYTSSFISEDEVMELPIKLDLSTDKITYGVDYRLEYSKPLITRETFSKSGTIILNEQGEIEDTQNLNINGFICTIQDEQVSCK